MPDCFRFGLLLLVCMIALHLAFCYLLLLYIQVWPSGTFVLAAHSVCDVQLTMQATKVCKTTERLNLVGEFFHKYFSIYPKICKLP